MKRLKKSRRTVLSLGLLLSAGLLVLFGGATDFAGQSRAHEAEAEKYLFVWAGDQARVSPDFLAVINFDEHSPDYGAVITTLPLSGPGATGNEPHHVGLSVDGKVLAAGGLLSFLKGQPQIFFFDVSDPTAPKFISSANPPNASITDEFASLAGGGFLVTMMGGPQGMAPGRVAEFNAQLNLVAEYPSNPPLDGFNPHGISIRPELNLMVTSDFICPASTLDVVPGNPALRGSIRVWDFSRRTILRTVAIPHAGGMMDVELIPGDQQGRAYTAGMGDGLLYLVDTKEGTATPVFDFSSIGGGMPQLMRMTKDGKRLFITLYQGGKVVMFDISEPTIPRLLAALDLGENSGPHYLRLTKNERRLVISDYFLNEDSFGKVHLDGDDKIHVVSVERDTMELDPRFQLDFNTAFPTGPARPHGMVFK